MQKTELITTFFTPEDIAFNQKMVKEGKALQMQTQAQKLLDESER